ncbi:CRISPR-associated protein Csx18 [Aliterella atlantica]|uniref:Uncharacterized protein n=1 Tax=Aliterella atlantica CENA595 TaxID=1618023 RepID=A0A0D8ZPV7_9CYAN|nr:CRISPR-associated protein Csx18 [Aliterella atlantica]KJH70755.1 hypothetical protein UH38_16100 [Aliterella atlantica CENA595]
MYISPRATLVRNVSVSLINGTVTLIILLIAPLGLMAVIINTVLIALATYIVSVGADRVTAYLQREEQAELLAKDRRSQMRVASSAKVTRRR